MPTYYTNTRTAEQIESETEQKLFDAGKMRREMRKETKEKNLQLHVGIDTIIV